MHSTSRCFQPPGSVGLRPPVVLLNLNPGHSPGDAAAHQLPEVRRAIVANLRQAPTRFPLFYLDPELAGIPGARWWQRSLHPLIECFGVEQVANQVVYPVPGCDRAGEVIGH
jgi:hypothetical protein